MANQLTLDLEVGLTEKFRCLGDVVAAGVYQRGLKRVAADLDKAPGNLSRELAGDSDRHFSVTCLERYIQTQGDLTPIYYLIARYMGDQDVAADATQRRIEALLAEAVDLARQHGSAKPKQARR